MDNKIIRPSKTTPATSLYLKSGRLSDVLALIQVLAYNKYAKRSNEGLISQLRRRPVTANSWIEIGNQHPEIFRVLEASEHHSNLDTVTLIARFVQEGIASEVEGEPPKSIPLSSDVTGKLMDLAIQLHDREVQRRDRLKSVLVPTFVAVIAAAASISGAVIGSMNKSPIQLCTNLTNSSAATKPHKKFIDNQKTTENKTVEKINK